jgi:hypothetical protein
MVVVEMEALRHAVDERETHSGTLRHGHRYGAIQGDDGRRLGTLENVVEQNNPPPVGVFSAFGPAVFGRNGCLQRVWTRSLNQRRPRQRQRLCNLPMIPSASILIFQSDQVTGSIEPRIATRIVKQHERE